MFLHVLQNRDGLYHCAHDGWVALGRSAAEREGWRGRGNERLALSFPVLIPQSCLFVLMLFMYGIQKLQTAIDFKLQHDPPLVRILDFYLLFELLVLYLIRLRLQKLWCALNALDTFSQNVLWDLIYHKIVENNQLLTVTMELIFCSMA